MAGSDLPGAVYAIGADNAVYEIGSSGVVKLGGYAKQISAGLDGFGHPEAFAIGLDDALYAQRGLGFVRLGDFVTEVSAPAVETFGIGLPGDLTYVVDFNHQGLLHRGTSFIPIGGGTVE